MDKPTVVRLPQTCPPGAIKVAALVLTDNPQASEIEYAIHVEDEGAGTEGRRRRVSASKMAWRRVSPREANRIELALDQPLQRPGTLYLATRVPKGGWDWFADAKVLRLQVQLGS